MKGAALLNTMADEVDARCESILQQARSEAEQIKAQAQREAETRREATLDATQASIAALDARSRQKAESEAARADLVVKSEVVEEVLAKVDAEIRRIATGPEFPQLLESLLSEVMAVAEGDVVVVGPEEHLDAVRQWLAANGHENIPVESAPEMWDGVAVQDPKQTYRISNTLTGRFRRVREDARRQCMIKLFGDTGRAEGAS